MERITSKDNEKIKWLIKLRENRKSREESASFLTEGTRMAQEVLRCGLSLQQVFASEDGAARHVPLWDALCRKAQAAYLVSGSLEAKISSVKAPQGIYCVCKMPQRPPRQIAGSGDKFLALDHLQDPGNLGTIIRTADAFGADGILLSEGCADCYSPKVLRSTMGSVFRLPVWTVPDLAQTLEDLKKEGFASFGAALDDTAVRLGEFRFPQKTVTVVGNEGNGISQSVLNACEKTLYIPMKGEAESLNAGVAASLILWEMCR